MKRGAPVRFPVLSDPDQLREMALTMTDNQMAASIGCAYKSVVNARAAFHIPACGIAARPAARTRPALLDDPRQLRRMVATMSDTEIAKKIGCSSGMVQEARHRFGMIKRIHVDSEYAGVIPTAETRPVTVVCSTCRWTHSTMATRIRNRWQLDFDSKLRQEGNALYHVPCGTAMTVYARLTPRGAR